MTARNHVRWLKETGLADLAEVGGKNATLGELAGALSGDIRVLESFAITAEANRDLIDQNRIWPRIYQLAI